jgi:glycosyltransferase involved in cell wall biosynthesis
METSPVDGSMMAHMRFVIDAHAIGRQLTGNEVYVRSLLNALVAEAPNCEYIAYVSSQMAREALSPRIQTRRVSGNPFYRLTVDINRRLRRDRPDLIHVQYTAPLACPAPVVVTIHDVSFLEHPEYFTGGRALQLQHTVRQTVFRAAKVLTGSEFSKQRILKSFPKLDESKVLVTPYAASPLFRPILRAKAEDAVRRRFLLRMPFVLSVGDLQPRKNQIGLITAFSRVVSAYPRLTHSLALVGKDTWFSGRVREAALKSGVAERIRFLGFVSDAELLDLYNGCDLFAFPSLYEGFGLPALEAMACGRAVVCSRTSALPEVVDGAAIQVDPASPDEIARALVDLLLDSELRARMERLGPRRAAHFTWQKTARCTLQAYLEVAAHSRTRATPREPKGLRSPGESEALLGKRM